MKHSSHVDEKYFMNKSVNYSSNQTYYRNRKKITLKLVFIQNKE